MIKLIVEDVKKSFKENKFTWLFFITVILLLIASLLFPVVATAVNITAMAIAFIVIVLAIMGAFWLAYYYIRNLVRRVRNSKTS